MLRPAHGICDQYAQLRTLQNFNALEPVIRPRFSAARKSVLRNRRDQS